MPNDLQRNYTRITGIYFLLITLSLIWSLYQQGYTPETWHKLFHIFLGVIVVKWGWSNNRFWKPFCIFNGILFLFAAAFGFAFPDFAAPQLEAFSVSDTFLHAIVGILGIGAYLSDRIRL